MLHLPQLPKLIGLTLISIVFVACSATATTTTAAPPEPADLVVTMNEWRFAPADVVLADGTSAVVELRNVGSVLHEWAVVDGTVETESDMSRVNVLTTLQVNPGATGRLELPELQPGVYDVVCPIPGHIANGMVGTLTVGG